jgi:hypothetical protein
MKRKLLIAALCLPFVSFSQSSEDSKINNQILGNAVSIHYNQLPVDKAADSTAQSKGKINPQSNAKRGVISYDFVKIGSTYYDLQTNASIGRRIIVLPDGNISAVWTTSNDAGYTNRGTGYNHFDGTSWLSVNNPTPRIENLRLGWPSIGYNGTKEWVMAHDAAVGGFVKSENQSFGSTSWNVGGSILSQNQRRPIWGRVANSGEIFHCIASYSDSSSPGDPRAPRINGVYAPMTYSRSLDGGNIWDIQHILLPGYDSSRILNGGGDQYAIDVRDSIVAIATGGLLEHSILWKSTDNGDSWEMIIMDSFRYAPYTSKTLMDTTTCGDGSIEVMIDKDGKVHAFWGLSRVIDQDTTDESYSFYPSTSALMYWNEITATATAVAGGTQFDRDNSGTLDLSAGCWSALQSGVVPQTLKNANIYGVARLGNTSLLRSPSAAIDADGNLYVTFSMPLEQDVDDYNVNRRDIYIIYSKDNGATWSVPQDLTQWQGFEEDFACIAKNANGFVHMIFQKDETAGTNLQNNGTDNNHPTGINDIMYAAIPVDKILNNEIGVLQSVDIVDLNKDKEVFVVSQNYPNPFNSNTEVMIWLNTESNVSVSISDINGKVIKTQNFGSMNAGNQVLSLNSSQLSAGIYFYTVSTGTHNVTKKMIVQ